MIEVEVWGPEGAGKTILMASLWSVLKEGELPGIRVPDQGTELDQVLHSLRSGSLPPPSPEGEKITFSLHGLDVRVVSRRVERDFEPERFARGEGPDILVAVCNPFLIDAELAEAARARLEEGWSDLGEEASRRVSRVLFGSEESSTGTAAIQDAYEMLAAALRSMGRRCLVVVSHAGSLRSLRLLDERRSRESNGSAGGWAPPSFQDVGCRLAKVTGTVPAERTVEAVSLRLNGAAEGWAEDFQPQAGEDLLHCIESILARRPLPTMGLRAGFAAWWSALPFGFVVACVVFSKHGSIATALLTLGLGLGLGFLLAPWIAMLWRWWMPRALEWRSGEAGDTIRYLTSNGSWEECDERPALWTFAGEGDAGWLSLGQGPDHRQLFVPDLATRYPFARRIRRSWFTPVFGGVIVLLCSLGRLILPDDSASRVTAALCGLLFFYVLALLNRPDGFVWAMTAERSVNPDGTES